MSIRCVLFDLDGTLMDSAPDLSAALNRVRAQEGQPPVALETLLPWCSTGARGLLHAGFGITREHPDYARLSEAFLYFYAEQPIAHSQPFPGIMALLDELATRGVSWGVVTNKSERFTTPIMAAFAWPSPPVAVTCADMVPKPKPDPASVFLACERAQLKPEECLYVGDAERDIAAGKAAGMFCLGVTWGYILPDSPPATWGADALIEHPLDLLPYLQAQA